jgi:hypothetical protein
MDPSHRHYRFHRAHKLLTDVFIACFASKNHTQFFVPLKIHSIPLPKAFKRKQISPTKRFNEVCTRKPLSSIHRRCFKRRNWIKDFYFKAPAVWDAKKECEQPLLSSQIINGSVTLNESAKMENNKNAKIGCKRKNVETRL